MQCKTIISTSSLLCPTSAFFYTEGNFDYLIFIQLSSIPLLSDEKQKIDCINVEIREVAQVM